MCGGVNDSKLFSQIDVFQYYILYTCDRDDIYNEALNFILKYVRRWQVIELFPRIKIGKYSYGPLMDFWYGIESIGAFCSFAEGTAIAGNHDVYISSHPFLSCTGDYSKHPGHMPGIEVAKPRIITRKTKIGNDVWIGRNAIIITGCQVGNGVIIGAGAVVTKDIPDYAVVAGVPAKTIRYRYNQEQIRKMNIIAWWDWEDEKIRENYMDFYLEIDEFIEKHYRISFDKMEKK